MSESDVLKVLRDFLEQEVIESPGSDIQPDTPLLELGILNSFSTMRLTSFIHRRFEVEIPPEDMTGRNFSDLRSISALVTRLTAASDSERQP
ncbi:hypothetical protein CDO52_00485 [Nocardiopsis gilva YIM 90087]|uniref:Carrier domain-containing protein n=1 Tax=Nocardiopsis gilva YIM 90087 TaxID=1235441 RepID=A0A223S000_9ACTN|nr:acyl carrier protein [Nocardiopsis gilva]ASU81455.1 hypothetical protein CDO52_00485 [Nocardiopsis gilva YIM 90087]